MTGKESLNVNIGRPTDGANIIAAEQRAKVVAELVAAAKSDDPGAVDNVIDELVYGDGSADARGDNDGA